MLVEGLRFTSPSGKEGQGFDKLSPNGVVLAKPGGGHLGSGGDYGQYPSCARRLGLRVASTKEFSRVSYKDSFQDRIGMAAKAREAALAKLKAKAPVDPKVVAERVERQKEREAREAETREAKRAAKAAADAEKAAKAAASAPPTEEERKAARDARYAARKARR